MRKLVILICVLMMSLVIGSCGHNDESHEIKSTEGASVKTTWKEDETDMYKMITMDEAKEIFKTEGDYIIVDVRRIDEFESGHIPGAINIPNEDIGIEEIAQLPNKEQTIYIYCRSGNRSKQASEKLVKMGYTNIIEFGGILNWTGEVVEGK